MPNLPGLSLDILAKKKKKKHVVVKFHWVLNLMLAYKMCWRLLLTSDLLAWLSLCATGLQSEHFPETAVE